MTSPKKESGSLPKKESRIIQGQGDRPASTLLHDVNDLLDVAFDVVMLRWLARLPYGIAPDVDRMAMWAAQRLRQR